MAGIPFITRAEGWFSCIPPVDWIITKIHQQRKKWYIKEWHQRSRQFPLALRNFEAKVYSTMGEDGILTEIFKRIGHGTKLCVEFGVGDGSECNTRNLIQHHGWSGILMDCVPEFVAHARSLYAPFRAQVMDTLTTAENILPLFQDLQVPAEPDLISVDIDGNDYWVLQAILREFRPRVIVVEYNARWAPPKRWVMPYDPSYSWLVQGGASVCFGASLASFTDLTGAAGYALVACGFGGINAFFVRNDEVQDRFSDVSQPLSYHYAAPLYTPGFGHPVRRGRTDGTHAPLPHSQAKECTFGKSTNR